MGDERKSRELRVSWQRIVSVWWLVVWRGMTGGIVLSLLIGLAVGAIANEIGLSRDEALFISEVGGGNVMLLWGVIVVLMALRKKYRSFRIALVSV